MKGKRSPDCNIELGLAILGSKEWRDIRTRWQRRLRLSSVPTFDEIAALCDCRWQSIRLIEQKTLRKCRIRLVEQLTEPEIRDALKALSRATTRKEYTYPR
jgi:hypothetical protein